MLREIRKIVVGFTAFALMISVSAMAKGRYHHGAASYFFLNKTDFRLEQAIQQLESENKGKVIAAKVRLVDDVHRFALKRLEEGGTMDILLDPESKEVVESGKESIFSPYNDEDLTASAAKAKITLLEAMNIAQKKYKGLVVSARYSARKTQNAFKVFIVTPEETFNVLVDAESGDTFRLMKNDKRNRRFNSYHR